MRLLSDLLHAGLRSLVILHRKPEFSELNHARERPVEIASRHSILTMHRSAFQEFNNNNIVDIKLGPLFALSLFRVMLRVVSLKTGPLK